MSSFSFRMHITELFIAGSDIKSATVWTIYLTWTCTHAQTLNLYSHTTTEEKLSNVVKTADSVSLVTTNEQTGHVTPISLEHAVNNHVRYTVSVLQ